MTNRHCCRWDIYNAQPGIAAHSKCKVEVNNKRLKIRTAPVRGSQAETFELRNDSMKPRHRGDIAQGYWEGGAAETKLTMGKSVANVENT